MILAKETSRLYGCERTHDNTQKLYQYSVILLNKCLYKVRQKELLNLGAA
jgi:hypothetical protein